MKLTNSVKIFMKIFYNDIQIRKKVASKLGKKTAYSSSPWCNSPRNVGVVTLHHFLEGVKKKFFIKITRLFLIFSRLVSKYLGIFPRSRGQTIAQKTQRTVMHRNTLSPHLPR